MNRKITLRARAAWWRGLVGPSGAVARPSSASRAVRASAPKPLAQRVSISRRVRGRGPNRPQCMTGLRSVQENELLGVEEHVREVCPGAHVVALAGAHVG